MSEEIDRWVKYMREHPNDWEQIHTKFIDAQFMKANDFIERLLKQPIGKEKIINAYGIKNLKGYRGLFLNRK